MNDDHCKDCCCAQSWKALEIYEYTGKSIPEHIYELKAQLACLRAGIEEAKHKLECYRVWNGKGWSWAASNPFHAERAWMILRNALEEK